LIWHWPHRKRRVQQFCSFLCIRCRRNMFSKPLPCNDKGIQSYRHRESRPTKEALLDALFSLQSERKLCIYRAMSIRARHPCGGGVEYLHCDPASRRRRRKGKSQIWESKIWSRVRRDSDPRKTKLARASSIYKRQTRPLVREGSPQKQDRNCQRVINILSWAPDAARHHDLLIDWPSIAMWIWLEFDLIWFD
jgi:hypothetical protein